MKNRKVVIITIVIIAVVLLSLASWLLYKKFFKKDSSGGDEKKDDVVPDFSSTPSSSSTIYSAPASSGISFPIKRGMKGAEVVKIQEAINKKCGAGLVTDGDFGRMTESALNSCYGTKEVSQALYTQMGFDKTSSPAPSKTGFSKGNKVYIKGDAISFYSFPEAKSKWIIGSIPKSLAKTNPIGTWVSKANGTFDKISIVAYQKLNGEAVVLSKPQEVFVYSSLISKSAY